MHSPSSRRLRALGLLARLPFREEPWRPVVGVSLQFVSQIGYVAIALLLKRVVDQLAGGRPGAAATVALTLGIGTLVTVAAGFASWVIRMGMVERTTLAADSELATLTGSIVTVEHLEDPEQLDRLELLRQDHRSLAFLPDVAAMAASTLVRLVATVSVLARVHPALLALGPFALPSVVATWRSQRRYARAHDRIGVEWRRQGTMIRLVGAEPGAREVRVFGGGPGVVARFDRSLRDSNAVIARAGMRSAVEQTAGWAVFGAAFAASLVVVARRAASGHATAGDLVLAITLGSQLTNQLAGLVAMISGLAAGLRTAERYGWLVERADAARIADGRSRRPPVPEALSEGIRFDRVSFRYPGQSHFVLRDVDLLLPAGATVAIVGDNGAGKSTLVKLLTRMYDPVEGRILVDGTPLDDFEATAWRDRTSAAFQDHAHLEFITQHVVGVGSLPALDDPAAVVAALDAAHAADVVVTLPDGLATQLGRQFDDGTELSGGQWQKLAVGRAMMRPDPLLLVLDEPTAALDAGTEAALFERYADAARRTRSTSRGVTVIVSHRFSTVRMADLIIVVDNGTIREVGRHAELMRCGGLYAELFELQSKAYR